MGLGVLGTLGAIGSGLKEAIPRMVEEREKRLNAEFASEFHRVSTLGSEEEMRQLLEDPRFTHVSAELRQRVMETAARVAERKETRAFRERQFGQKVEGEERGRRENIATLQGQGYEVDTALSAGDRARAGRILETPEAQGGGFQSFAENVSAQTPEITSVRRGPELERQFQAKTDQADATLAKTRADRLKTEAETRAADERAAGGGLTPRQRQQAFESQSKIIRELATTKDAIEANRKFETLVAILSPILDGKSHRLGARQIAAMNSFQRMIDDAVVRSDDIKMLLQAQGLTERWYTKFSNLVKGDVLSAELTQDMYDTAFDMVKAIHQVGQGQINNYLKALGEGEMYPEDVINALGFIGAGVIPPPPTGSGTGDLIFVGRGKQ